MNKRKEREKSRKKETFRYEYYIDNNCVSMRCCSAHECTEYTKNFY